MHDAYRVDKGGKPTFDRVMRGLDVLRRHEVDWNVLTTIHAVNGDTAARQPVTELTLPAQTAGAPEARTEVQLRYVRGEGTVLEGDGPLFYDVLVRTVTAAEVRAWLERGERRYAKLIGRSVTFRQGEALIAGKIAPTPPC
jgi:hypothetical protein